MKRWVIGAIVFGVFLFWGAAWGGVYFSFNSWAERGQFGDLFGSVNALFSGLAFAGLIVTIFLQRQELSLQRDELRLQREEMVASRAELAHQAQVAIGQIKVAALQTRIEGIKMHAESQFSGAKGDFIKDINRIADEIKEIAAQLESAPKDT